MGYSSALFHSYISGYRSLCWVRHISRTFHSVWTSLQPRLWHDFLHTRYHACQFTPTTCLPTAYSFFMVIRTGPSHRFHTLPVHSTTSPDTRRHGRTRRWDGMAHHTVCLLLSHYELPLSGLTAWLLCRHTSGGCLASPLCAYMPAYAFSYARLKDKPTTFVFACVGTKYTTVAFQHCTTILVVALPCALIFLQTYTLHHLPTCYFVDGWMVRDWDSYLVVLPFGWGPHRPITSTRPFPCLVTFRCAIYMLLHTCTFSVCMYFPRLPHTATPGTLTCCTIARTFGL